MQNCYNIKVLKEAIKENVCDIGLNKDFFDMT